MDDALVIDQVREGRTEEFSHIVERYEAPIKRYLLRITGDFDVAQDLAQDTFFQAYRGILETRSDLSLKSWLYKIATNNARQYHRRRRILSFLPLMGWESANEPGGGTLSDSVNERLTVQQAMVRVPHDRRVHMVLHFVEGLKYREIAEIFGTSEEAVRKQVSRGSKDFREAYRFLSEGNEK